MMKVGLMILALVGSAGAAMGQGRAVYMGIDPAYHWPSVSEGLPLIQNATNWAGKSTNPTIGYYSDGSFGENLSGAFAALGYSSYTALTASDLVSGSLGGYDVVYIGPTTAASAFAGASGNLTSYLNGGGGLIIEPEVFDSNSWLEAPYQSLIGHSGSVNVGNESVTIVAGSDPVMAGLSDAGLSNWGSSVHSNFATPEAGGFYRLTNDVASGNGHIIAFEVPAPGSLALLGLGGLAAARRRR